MRPGWRAHAQPRQMVFGKKPQNCAGDLDRSLSEAEEGGPGRPVLPLPGSEGRKMLQELGKGGTRGFTLQLTARVPAEAATDHGAGRKGAGERLTSCTSPMNGQQGRRAGALLAVEMKFTARLSAREREGGASWERDGACECGSLAFCSHRRGKAVSFAGLIGLMRFPYSSLRGCQQAWLACHFPLLTAYPLCKRRREEERDRSPDRSCRDPVVLSGTGCSAHADAFLTSPAPASAALLDLLGLRLGTTSPFIPPLPSPGAQLVVVLFDGMHVGPRRGRTKDVHHSCLTSAVTHRLLSLRGTIAPNLPPLQPLLPFPLTMTVTLQWPETPGDTAMLLSYHRTITVSKDL